MGWPYYSSRSTGKEGDLLKKYFRFIDVCSKRTKNMHCLNIYIFFPTHTLHVCSGIIGGLTKNGWIFRSFEKTWEVLRRRLFEYEKIRRFLRVLSWCVHHQKYISLSINYYRFTEFVQLSMRVRSQIGITLPTTFPNLGRLEIPPNAPNLPLLATCEMIMHIRSAFSPRGEGQRAEQRAVVAMHTKYFKV